MLDPTGRGRHSSDIFCSQMLKCVFRTQHQWSGAVAWAALGMHRAPWWPALCSSIQRRSRKHHQPAASTCSATSQSPHAGPASDDILKNVSSATQVHHHPLASPICLSKERSGMVGLCMITHIPHRPCQKGFCQPICKQRPEMFQSSGWDSFGFPVGQTDLMISPSLSDSPLSWPGLSIGSNLGESTSQEGLCSCAGAL